MSLPQPKTAILTVKTSESEERSWMPVRDRRAKNWHWKLNAFHEEIFVPESEEVITFAALLGPSACAVYDYLCRRADEETQTCFPSNPTIAFGTGQSEPTVIEAIASLCFYGLLWKESREADEGDPTSNLFFLLPVESWTLDGGQWEVSEDHAKRMTARRRKLHARKVPYYLRRRFFPGTKKSVEAVKNFDHPPKMALPHLVKIFGDGSQDSLPPLEEASIESDSEEKTTTNTPAALLSANADVVAQSSLDVLSPAAASTRRVVSTSNQAVIPVSAALPKKKLPTDEANVAVELSLRLCELAEAEFIELDAADAAAIVGTWRETAMSRAAVATRMRELKVAPKTVNDLVRSHEIEVRWQLAHWSRRPQADHGYFKTEGGTIRGTRGGTFSAAVREPWQPYDGAAWVVSLKAGLTAQKRREQLELDKDEAGKYFEGLPAPRRKRFIEDLLAARLREKAIFEVGSEAWDIVRVSMLLEPKVRAEIESWDMSAKPARVSPLTEAAPTEITPKVAVRLALHVSRLRFALEDGDFGTDELNGKCRALPGLSTAEAQWVEAEVLAALKQRKAA